MAFGPRLPAVLALASLLLFTGLGSAADSKSTARALAVEGQEAFDAKNYQRAADLLERAEKYFHAPPHLVLEARARIALGQLVEARELLLAVVNEPASVVANDAFRAAREEASRLLPQLEPRLSRLTIEMETGPPSDLRLLLDDAEIASDLLGVATPVNPGEHVVVGRAAGYDEFRSTIVLREGETDKVVLRLVPTAPAEPAATDPDQAAVTSSVADRPPQRRGPRLPSYALWSGGIVGVGVGVTLLFTGADKNGQAAALLEADCTPLSGGQYGCSPATNDKITELDQQAATQQTVGVILLAAGAAALIGGTVLALVPARQSTARHQPARTRWSAIPLLGGAYIGVQGEFR